MIDYVIMSKSLVKDVEEIIIDEEGTHRIKSDTVHSDHNTILIKMNIRPPTVITTETRWNTANKEGWKKYNANMRNKHINTYDDLEKHLNHAMKESIGKKTIRKGQRQYKASEEVKEKKNKRKEAKKKYNQAVKNKDPKTREILKEYRETRRELRETIHEQEKKNTRKKLNDLIRKGATRAQDFWRERNKINRKDDCNYDTKDDNGNVITNPEKVKEHVATYSENLYQAREGTPEYQEWTKIIHTKQS